MPYLRDFEVHLEAGELAALTGLCPLRDLDLQLARVYEVVRGHAETRRRHLLDRAARGIAIGKRNVARFVLPALTRIARRAEPVHGNGEGDVCFLADRAE